MNRWKVFLDGLSPWQFAAVWAGLSIFVIVAAACVYRLVTGHLNLGQPILYGFIFAASGIGARVWRRWN